MTTLSVSKPGDSLHVDNRAEMLNLQAENAQLREENARLRRRVDELYDRAYPGLRPD